MAAVKELIKSATIARVTDKSGKFLGFYVKSNSDKKVWYEVTCLKIDGECLWDCTCDAKEWGYAGRCNHIKACKQVCAARKAQKEQAAFLDNLDCFFLAASRYAFKQVCPPANNSRFAINLKYTPAQEEAAEQEIRAEVALATIAQAEAILAEERRKNAPLNGQSRKVETTPWGTSVLMR